MSGQDELEIRPIDDARREQLRRDPKVRSHRPEPPVPFVPDLRAEGVQDIRTLLDRDDDQPDPGDPA